MKLRSALVERNGPSPLLLIVIVAVMAGLFLAVMPIRTYLEQHRTAVTVSHQLSSIEHENATLQSKIDQFKNPAQIQRIARIRYGMVQPGQKPFVILPAPGSGNQVGSVPRGAAVPETTSTTVGSSGPKG